MSVFGKKKLTKLALLFILLSFTILFQGFSSNAVSLAKSPARSNESRVSVIVLLDSIGVDSLAGYKNADRVFKEFDYAIVSARSGAPLKQYSPSSLYATLNSGDRVLVSEPESAGFFNLNESIPEMEITARDYYYQLQGKEASSSIVFPNAGIISSSAIFDGDSMIVLGRMLKEAGVLRFAYGNGDLSNKNIYRGFCLVLVDEEGLIDKGDVSRETLIADNDFPGGKRFDYQGLAAYLSESIERLKKENKSAIILIYPGDFRRLDSYSGAVSSERIVALRNEIFEKTFLFVDSIKNSLDKDDLIAVMSVCPEREKVAQGSNTGFILLSGWLYEGGKLLESMTTKKAGAVFIADVSNTIAKYFNLHTNELKGNPIIESRKTTEPEKIAEMAENFLTTDKLRSPMISTYVVLIIVTIFTTLLFLLAPYSQFLKKLVESMIFSSALIPVLFFVFGPVYSRNIILGIAAVTSVFLFSLILYRKYLFSLVSTSAVFLGILSLGIFLDAPFSFFNRNSVLGYSFNTGARFYGIGNEHMGIMGAGIFLLLSIIAQGMRTPGARSKKDNKNLKDIKSNSIGKLTMLLVIIIFFVVWALFPFAGANVGGSIAILFGSLAIMYYSRKGKLSSQLVIIYTIFFALLLGLFLIISLLFPGFHLSKFVRSAISSDFNSALQIIYRKISLNLKLLRYTVWNKFLLAIIIGLPFLVINPNDILHRFFKKDAWAESLIVGTAIGAIAAFVFNDSGVVAAATMLVYPTLIFLSELLILKSEAIDPKTQE